MIATVPVRFLVLVYPFPDTGRREATHPRYAFPKLKYLYVYPMLGEGERRLIYGLLFSEHSRHPYRGLCTDYRQPRA